MVDASGWLQAALSGGVIYFTCSRGSNIVYRMGFPSCKQSLSAALLPCKPRMKLQGKQEPRRDLMGKGISRSRRALSTWGEDKQEILVAGMGRSQ